MNWRPILWSKRISLTSRCRGFTLLEVVVSAGLAFLLMLTVWAAFFISHSLFQRGEDIINEKMFIQILFAKMEEEFKYLSRPNELSPERNEFEFELFEVQRNKVSSDSDDWLVIGQRVRYYLTSSLASDGTPYMRLQHKITEYEWIHRFGHSLALCEGCDDAAMNGRYMDMSDVNEPMRDTDDYPPELLCEEERGREFLLQKIEFIPLDSISEEMFVTGTYEDIKDMRGMRIKIEYLIKRDYGEFVQTEQVRNCEKVVGFVNLAMGQYEECCE